MSAGKRHSTEAPLTEHDVAERLDRAALRVLRIMMDVRQIEGLMEQVIQSRYLTNCLAGLAAELQMWGIEPEVLRVGVYEPEVLQAVLQARVYEP